MSSVVDIIHAVLSFAVSGFISALESAGPGLTLLLISLLSGIVLVFFYGKVSFQNKLRDVKRGIHAALLEVILFRHSPLLSLRAQGRMLIGGLHYLALAIPPILILALPCIFLMAQLQTWYGYESLQPGTTTVVRVSLPETQPLDTVSLSSDPSVQITGPLRSVADHEVLWRVHPSQAGKFPLNLKISESVSIPSELVVGNPFSRIDTLLSSHLADKLLYPPKVNSALPKSSVDRFEVTYPERSFSVAGYHMHWVVLFLIISLLGGIAGGRFLKVEL